MVAQDFSLEIALLSSLFGGVTPINYQEIYHQGFVCGFGRNGTFRGKFIAVKNGSGWAVRKCPEETSSYTSFENAIKCIPKLIEKYGAAKDA